MSLFVINQLQQFLFFHSISNRNPLWIEKQGYNEYISSQVLVPTMAWTLVGGIGEFDKILKKIQI